MTGAEFKQFVLNHDWSPERAANLFGINRATLFREYKREKVDGRTKLACELYLLVPKNKLKLI